MNLNESIMTFNGTPGDVWTNSFAQTRTLSQVAEQYVNGFMYQLKSLMGGFAWFLIVLDAVCIFLIFLYDHNEQKRGWMSWILLLAFALNVGFFVRFLTLIYRPG